MRGKFICETFSLHCNTAEVLSFLVVHGLASLGFTILCPAEDMPRRTLRFLEDHDKLF